jgi:hypothetical protein
MLGLMGQAESGLMDHAAVEAVLAGERSYDEVNAVEQAAVRRVWDERIAERRAGLDLAAEFRAKGWTPWSEAHAEGNTVYRS